MQELKVEEEAQIRRECKGRRLAISRNVFRLRRTDVFYVQSDSSDIIYYYVKYNPDVLEWCSCPDNSTKQEVKKCKHIYAIEFAIKLGTLKDTDKLPAEAKRYPHDTLVVVPPTKSYTEDQYDF